MKSLEFNRYSDKQSTLSGEEYDELLEISEINFIERHMLERNSKFRKKFSVKFVGSTKTILDSKKHSIKSHELILEFYDSLH